MGSPLLPRGAPIPILPTGSQDPYSLDTKEGGRKRGVRARVSTRSRFVKYLPFFTIWAAAVTLPPLELFFQETFEIPTTLGGFVCLVVIFVL